MAERRYFRSILLFALLILGTLLSASLLLSRDAQAQSANLLTNPGFDSEQGDGQNGGTFTVVTSSRDAVSRGKTPYHKSSTTEHRLARSWIHRN